MRYIPFTILLGILSVQIALPFHEKEQSCEKCHLMHYNKDDGDPQTDVGPFAHLLTKERSTELCLQCHNGKAETPDVIGDDINNLAERAAGFFSAMNTENINGHNLQADKIGPSALCSTCHSGGNSITAKVGCTDCHDPHGNESYRNLRLASEPDNGTVIKAFVNPSVTGLQVYEQRNIAYVAPVTKASNWREVTNICFGCHHVASNEGYTRNSDGTPIRHPVTDSERGIWEAINKYKPPQTDPAHWKNGVGIGFTVDRVPFIVSDATNYSDAKTIATQSSSVTNEVFCLTCHKAHGSNYSFSLRWLPDSSLGCQQCHNKG